MAGILDSDLMQFLVTPRAFMARRNAMEDAKQFQGLLGTLEQQGPVQPGGGLLASREPDAAFWLKAAQIPSYQDIASQQLGYGAQNIGALQRQMQQQQFARHNLTADQAADNDLAERQFGFRQYIDSADLARKQYGTQASAASSYASAASSDASRRLSELNYADKARDYRIKTQGTLYDNLNAPDKVKANDALSLSTGRAGAAMDIVDWVQERATGSQIRGIGKGLAPAMDAEWQLAVLPAVKDMMGAGALDNSEREFMASIIGNPGDVLSTEAGVNKLRVIAQKVEDERRRTFQKYELQVPELQKGQSAVARALSQGKPVGEQIDWKGGDAKPSLWFPGEKSGAGTYRLGR